MTTSRIALVLALLAISAPAAAQDDVLPTEGGMVEPAPAGGAPLTDRPFFVGGGIGGTFGLNGGAAFSIEEDIGYRFFGFVLGGNLDGAIWAGLSFGQSFGDGFYLLQFDARGGADLELWDGGDMQLLVTPSLALGGAVAGTSVGGFSTTAGAFDLQISAQGELVMLEGLLGIWLRPLSFEFLINDSTLVRYELLAGVLVHL